MTSSRDRFGRLLLALAIGAVGGGVFYLLDLPLAWMLGAMCTTTVAALAGAPLGMSWPLRTTMICILSTLLGSAFTLEIANQILNWFGGAVVMAAFVASVFTLALTYFLKA